MGKTWWWRSGRQVSIDQILNERRADAYPALRKRLIALHEIGHVLGIAHSGGSQCSGLPLMVANVTTAWNCDIRVPTTDEHLAADYIY